MKKNSLFVKIMVWVLSVAMVAGGATLTIWWLMDMLAK